MYLYINIGLKVSFVLILWKLVFYVGYGFWVFRYFCIKSVYIYILEYKIIILKRVNNMNNIFIKFIFFKWFELLNLI